MELAPRRVRRLVRRILEEFWTPVGAGVKSEEEVDALVLYLFGYDERGREMLRELDSTVAEIPGLDGLTLTEAFLDQAHDRACRRPGWAGVVPPSNSALRM